jgi:DNA-binding MarR family transcriptional regulator
MRRAPRLCNRDLETIDRLYYDEGYTQKDIAVMANYDQGGISRIVNGISCPSRENLLAKKLATLHDNRNAYAGNRRLPSSRKLTTKSVRLIRRMYFSGGFSQKGLAAIFAVAQSTISRIVRGEKWAWV